MKKYIFLLLCTAISFGQASNQMVSFTQAASLGFALNRGQSHVTSTQCMTKLDAFTKYKLAVTDNTNTLTNNHLMRRDFWVAVVVSYNNIYSEVTSTSVAGMCALMPASVLTSYKSTSGAVVNGSVLYTNSNLTTPVLGNGQFYGIDSNIGRISNGGVVSEYQACVTSFVQSMGSVSEVSNGNACLNDLNLVNRYTTVATVVVGTVIYLDAATTIRMNGSSRWWYHSNTYQALRIDANGVVTDMYGC